MSKKFNKNSAKARRRGGDGPNFFKVFRYVMNSPAYASLSLAARAALVEVTHGYNGSNNGRIILSVRQLAERMGCAINTAHRALQELVDKGFIEPRVKGAFSNKFMRATEWRLNDRHCDVTGKQSQAFLKWRAPEPKVSAKAPTDTPPWVMLGMSQRTWYRQGKPTAPVGGGGKISRYQNLRPSGIKICDTRSFSGKPERYQNLIHSGTNNGLKIEDTSISTRDSGAEGAAEEARADTAVPWDDDPTTAECYRLAEEYEGAGSVVLVTRALKTDAPENVLAEIREAIKSGDTLSHALWRSE